MTVPVTTVTTIEASDWLCSMQLDRSADERPRVELVMARMVVKGQLEERREKERSARYGSNPYCYTVIVCDSIQARLDDTYLHVPGSGKSWTDNRTLLPFSSLHHWGRAIAVGSLAVNTAITLSSAEPSTSTSSSSRVTRVCVSGEGSSVILEWSQTTASTLMVVLAQLDTRYQILTKWLPTRQPKEDKDSQPPADPYSELLLEPGGGGGVQQQPTADLVIGDTSLHVAVVLNGVNAFVYEPVLVRKGLI